MWHPGLRKKMIQFQDITLRTYYIMNFIEQYLVKIVKNVCIMALYTDYTVCTKLLLLMIVCGTNEYVLGFNS